MNKYCLKCKEENDILTPISYKMFDIDGYNLEELPICDKNKDHNSEHIHYNAKYQEDNTHYYLTEDNIFEE